MFFGHMLGDIYSWMLDGYVSTCFFHFWRIFSKFSPEMLTFTLRHFLLGFMIYHWIWGLILANFRLFLQRELPRWYSVKPHSAGSEDRTGLMLMKIKMKKIMMMKNNKRWWWWRIWWWWRRWWCVLLLLLHRKLLLFWHNFCYYDDHYYYYCWLQWNSEDKDEW